MGDYTIMHDTLANLGDAVRTVVGSGEPMTPVEMAEALNNYKPPKGDVVSTQIKFIDYDGKIIDGYTAKEWESVTTLPDNPAHEGLVSQGWNWTKAQIDSQLAAAPDGPVLVGQMYITESRDTEIDISLDELRRAPYLGCAVDGAISIDWGDNSTPDTVTGTSLTTPINTQHTYAAAGEYTIRIHVENGEMAFVGVVGSGQVPILNNNVNNSVTADSIYSCRVNEIRLGNNTSIGRYAFNYCLSLSSITIPNTVTSIGEYAFNNCFALSSITIPNTVTSIGQYAFRFCCFLSSITIPDSVTSIERDVFDTCYALSSITIPESVTSIGAYAFNYCSALSSITIPNTVTSIGEYAFRSCFLLSSITIPGSVTSIGEYAFHNCYALSSITIPKSVTSIGAYAFYSCYLLPSITISGTVTSIGSNAFYRCYGLSSIAIPNTVTSIGTYAFYQCFKLSSITIPASVTEIANNAFSGCFGMKEYHFLSTTPPTLGGTSVFSNIPSDCIIYVPEASLNAYKTASRWSTHASKMVGE